MSVTLHTNFGDIKIELYCDESPNSSKNFLALAAAGLYDGTLFHRSVAGFIVQGGDPTGTGKGGSSWTGELEEAEQSALELKHDRRGVVSLAMTPGKARSVGSQFFITYARQPSLNGEYPVIGRVIDGLDTLQRIESVSVSEKKFRPLEDYSGCMKAGGRVKMPACGFYVTVRDSDKQVPTKIRKTAKGKKVTVISQITGDREKALMTLKQMLGVGGETCVDAHDSIELQGDQTKRIDQTLRSLGALVGLVEPAKAGPVTVERRNYGYDKFAKKAEVPAEVVATEMSEACRLVHGWYWPYCTGFCQYSPPLTDVFEGLDMYCSWFEPSLEKPKSSQPEAPMSDADLNQALSELGLKAETGQALLKYHEERFKRAEDFERKIIEKKKREYVPPPVAPPRYVSAYPAPNRPVRIILNRPARTNEYWWCFLLKVRLSDRSLWMADYEEFLVSLMREADLGVLEHEMEDSRTVELRFEERKQRDLARAVLETALPGFFQTEVIDPEIDLDEEGRVGDASDEGRDEDASPDEAPSVPPGLEPEPALMEEMRAVQAMAAELGLENNEQFWETLCEVMDAYPEWDVQQMVSGTIGRLVDRGVLGGPEGRG